MSVIPVSWRKPLQQQYSVRGGFFFFFPYKAAPILALYIPSIFMIWMTKFIHGETAFPRGKKKRGLKRLRYLLRSIIDVGMEAMHWLFHRRFHLFAWGLLIHQKKKKTHQVGFCLTLFMCTRLFEPRVDYEENFSKLFKCIAVEVDIFTQSSTLRFLIQ